MAEKKRTTARELAKQMKEISFSEFIATNPHLVGFESSVKMIPMSIHEILTNSLDACESAGILPEVWIDLKSLDDRGRLKRYKLTVRDNGPGIMPRNVPLVFGKLLYGSKFGVRCQSAASRASGVRGRAHFPDQDGRACLRPDVDQRPAGPRLQARRSTSTGTRQGAPHQHRESGRLARHRNFCQYWKPSIRRGSWNISS